MNASTPGAMFLICVLQELLPDHLLKETKAMGDKGKGTGKQWPFGWGKKKGDKEHEALPTPDAEVLKVLKHLHNVEKRFYYPQMFLSLDCQCTDDVAKLQYMFWD